MTNGTAFTLHATGQGTALRCVMYCRFSTGWVLHLDGFPFLNGWLLPHLPKVVPHVDDAAACLSMQSGPWQQYQISHPMTDHIAFF